jgi:hypothetical protein
VKQVSAIIKQGYRVGSGQAHEGHDQRFNEDGGTIRLQIPEFKKRGLDFDNYFGGKADDAYVVGTLGCDITPYQMVIAAPEYYLTDVRWTNKFDDQIPGFKENFFLSPAEVEFKGKRYKALLYVPDPSTKPAHFHPLTTIEVIAQKVPDIGYGDSVTLHYNPQAIQLELRE